jgi:hypothetical protein
MPMILYLVIINILVRIGATVGRKRRQPKPAPMCATCSFAHMQYAVGGKRAISCTFAGGLRMISIDVMYCTDYSDRAKPVRISVIGFVREAPESQALPEAAIAER